jgi:hypothetical protein
LDFITENYEEGINAMTEEEIIDLVDKRYRYSEKMKLIRFTEAQKMKYNFTKT